MTLYVKSMGNMTMLIMVPMRTIALDWVMEMMMKMKMTNLYKIKVYPRYLVTSEAHKTSSWSYQLKKAQKRRDLV
jgi:hypothetical protein